MESMVVWFLLVCWFLVYYSFLIGRMLKCDKWGLVCMLLFLDYILFIFLLVFEVSFF